MIALQINTTACNGTDVFWPWLLWLIGAFILGLIFGWLLKQLFGGSYNDTSEHKAKIKELQEKLDKCEVERNALSLSKANAATTAGVAAGAAMAATATKKPDSSVKDDLTKIEGIGPKIKNLLYDDGIWSFAQLSEVQVSRLQKILDKAGPRYRVHNPKTWPEQAKMAAAGNWDALKKWQDELKGGV